ncbi:MAG: adenosylmethionine decarboxylase [Candidatus Pacebacteria bacterium]|nr:adenosylmethionine decarboxylase [Candidatus Paceibacterota bacterium]
MNHFGEHVTLDGYNGEFELLNDKDVVQNALQDLPEYLGMTILGGPVVYFAEGNDIKDPGGWSGFVVIEESHISIHTFPARGFVSADVYTCQNGLDQEKIIGFFRDKFKIKSEEVNFIKRGTRYPSENLQ